MSLVLPKGFKGVDMSRFKSVDDIDFTKSVESDDSFMDDLITDILKGNVKNYSWDMNIPFDEYVAKSGYFTRHPEMMS